MCKISDSFKEHLFGSFWHVTRCSCWAVTPSILVFGHGTMAEFCQELSRLLQHPRLSLLLGCLDPDDAAALGVRVAPLELLDFDSVQRFAEPWTIFGSILIQKIGNNGILWVSWYDQSLIIFPILLSHISCDYMCISIETDTGMGSKDFFGQTAGLRKRFTTF